MTDTTPTLHQERLHCPRLPLAIYREVAAHLRQVTGVSVELQTQTSEQFDYEQSQIAAIALSYPADLAAAERDRLTAILDHYAQRYGSWERQPLPPSHEPVAQP